MPIKLNISSLNNAIAHSFATVVGTYADEARIAIESPIYSWDGFTLRQNGSIAGSPRDIVDTGELRDSEEVVFLNADSAIVQWTADYARAVHDGVPGKTSARKWTEVALENVDLSKVMAKELRKRL